MDVEGLLVVRSREVLVNQDSSAENNKAPLNDPRTPNQPNKQVETGGREQWK